MFEWPFGVRFVPFQTHMLSHMPWPPGQHPEFGHGEGRLQRQIPMQTLQLRMHSIADLHRENRARGDVRMSPISMPLSGSLVQMARTPRSSHATPDDVAQKYHHPTGRGHCFPRNRHQSAGRRRLGHDAIVLWPSFHACSREAGEVRWPSAVLRHRPANRIAQGGREFRLSTGIEWESSSTDVGGDAKVNSRRRCQCNTQLGLPGLRYVNRTTLCRQWQSRHQRYHIDCLNMMHTVRRQNIVH